MTFDDIIDSITAGQFWAGVVFIAGLILIARRYRMGGTTRGSAHWMKLWQAAWARVGAAAAGIGLFLWVDLQGNPGFLLGDWRGIPVWRFHIPCLLGVYYRGASNILTVGSPRSMKGAGVIIPNALRHKFLAVVDPGGEISAVCVKEWRRQGLNIHLLNPMGVHTGLPHNLASGSLNVCDDLDPNSDSFASTALLYASQMVGSAPRGEDGNYFHQKSFGAYQALFMHVKIKEAPERQNLVRIRQYLRGSMLEWAQLVTDMTDSKDAIVKAQGHEWQRMMINEPKAFGGIISTMEIATKWLDDVAIQNSVRHSNIRLKDLKGYDEQGRKIKGAVFAVILPLEFKTSHAAFVRLAITSVLRTMMDTEKRARSRVLLQVDEFNSLGKFDALVQALSEMGKYKLRIHLVTQSIAQAKDTYGEAGWKVIEGSCDVRQYLSAWGLDTAEHVSKMCGDTSIVEKTANGEQLISRHLITPDEVMRMSMMEQIVFINNLSPVKLRIRPYWERPGLRGKFYDNPFYYPERTPGLPLSFPLQALLGFGLRVLSGLIGPGAVVAAIAAAVAFGGFL
ncbi:type IV secretory system conjugative DNA transfer family protein [Rhodopila sp.]|uniref:type IV secretory system conjugative DNA transfer family protein n=1 Tax=Rhodopila sp. TaxID=2480087 RepID=UPI003D13801D